MKLGRELCETYHYKPWELDQFTLTELMVLYFDRPKGSPHSSKCWKLLTPEQKLRAMRYELRD